MRSRTTAALMATALLVAGCTTDDGGDGKARKTPAAEGSTAVTELFVASASEGTLEPRSTEHEFTLTLGKAHDTVGVFTDRPVRKAGTESLADFTDAWGQRGFTKTPPNAAVVWGKDSSTRVFELSDPSYDAAADTLAFTAHDLGDEPSSALSTFKGTPDAELPTELGEVSVFIDNACGGPPRSGAQLSFDLPSSGTATITVKDQIVDVVNFSPGSPAGTGEKLSTTQFEVSCDKSKPSCQIDATFSLNPGTWPVQGALEASPGVKVRVDWPWYANNGSLSAGNFSIAGYSDC